MSKRPKAKRTATKSEAVLRVRRGETIKFPVPQKHPFARFQTLTPVRSAEDISEFLRLWEHVAAAREQPPVTPDTLVAQFKKAKVSVLRLSTRKLRLDRRATIILNNPLNQLEFDSITITGDLISRGELVLNAKTLTID